MGRMGPWFWYDRGKGERKESGASMVKDFTVGFVYAPGIHLRRDT